MAANMTLEDAKKKLRLARDILQAVRKGERAQYVQTAKNLRADVSCENMELTISVLYVFAADAALKGEDSDFYSKPADAIQRAGEAQGCDFSS
jgi:hypothetical protein